jgi:hypothetical protein
MMQHVCAIKQAINYSSQAIKFNFRNHLLLRAMSQKNMAEKLL